MSRSSRRRRRRLAAATIASLAAFASPAGAAGTQTFDATVRLSCPLVDEAGNSWRGTQAIARVRGTVPAEASPGTVVVPSDVTFSLRALSSAPAQSGYVLDGRNAGLTIALAGGTANDFRFENDEIYPTTPMTDGGWGPIDVPWLSPSYSGSSITTSSAPTTVSLTSVRFEAQVSPGPGAPWTFPRERFCTPEPSEAVMLTIASPPNAPAPPSISELQPATGSVLGGTVVTIRGGGFDRGQVPVVTFGGRPATGVSVVDDATLRATTPEADFAGVAQVQVLTDGRVSLLGNAANYTYASPDLIPAITSISPPSGPVGTIVTVKGRNFGGIFGMEFGFVYLAGPEGPSTSTEFTLQVPAELPLGKADLIVRNRFGQSSDTAADDFTVTAPVPLPTVSYITPTITRAGTGGTLHFVVGKDLGSTRFVKVGTKSVKPLIVLTPQIAIFEAPAQAAGTYRVAITTKDGRTAPTSSTLRYR